MTNFIPDIPEECYPILEEHRKLEERIQSLEKSWKESKAVKKKSLKTAL